MDKREYLRSLGFEVGERGRFSAEMQTALANADIVFDAPEKKRVEVEREHIRPHVPPQVAVRKPKKLKGRSKEGYIIEFVTCFDCHYHMMYCNCAGGVKAPSSVASSKDPLVRV